MRLPPTSCTYQTNGSTVHKAFRNTVNRHAEDDDEPIGKHCLSRGCRKQHVLIQSQRRNWRARSVEVKNRLPLHLGEAALGRFDMAITEKVLTIMCVPELVRADFASRVHRMLGLPLELSGGGMRLTACVHVRVRALRIARHRVARYADECDTDRAWVLRDLWTGAFDVQVVVPTTERPRGLELALWKGVSTTVQLLAVGHALCSRPTWSGTCCPLTS